MNRMWISVGAPGATAEGSEVGFDILFPPSDAGGAIRRPDAIKQQPATTDDDEAIPFSVSTSTGMSGVDLGAAPAATGEAGRSSILDVLLRNRAAQTSPSGFPAKAPVIDEIAPAARAAVPSAPAAGNRPSSASIQPPVDTAADSPPPDSSVNFGGSDSSVGSDDAVDLYAETSRPASLTDSGTLEVSEEAFAESQRRAEQLESSSVDLNSRPTVSSSEFEIDVQSSANSGRTPSDSDVDLTPPPVADDGSSSLIRNRSSLEAEESSVPDEFGDRRRERAALEQSSIRSRSRRDEVIPSNDDEVPPARRRGYLLHGGVLGLLLGAGSVLAAYFGGVLPSTRAQNADNDLVLKKQLADAERQAQVAKLKADSAEEELRKARADAGLAEGASLAESIKKLATDKSAAESELRRLTASAQKAMADVAQAKKAADDATAAELRAKKSLVDAQNAAAAAQSQLSQAMKAVQSAKAETLAATQAGANALKAAETKQKQAELAAAKKESALLRLADAAKKSAVEAARTAADANKARDALAATLAAIGERLVKAKFVAAKPNSAALLKGLDDAMKVASADATGGFATNWPRRE